MLGSFQTVRIEPLEIIEPKSVSLNKLLREMIITKTDNSVIVDRKKFEQFEELLHF